MRWDEVRWEWVLGGILIASFMVLVLQDFFFPGFQFIYRDYEDELLSLNWFAWLKGAAGCNYFGLCPLYHGNLNSYLMLPFFCVFGGSWTVIRLWPVAWAVGTILVGYFFIRKAFGRWEAMIFLFLCAVDPAFGIAVRVGNFHQSTTIFYSTACLLGFHRWWITKDARWLSFGVIMAGLGMMTRLWFIWFLAGLFVSAVVFFPWGMKWWGLPRVFKTIVWSALPFVLISVVSEITMKTLFLFYENRDNTHQIWEIVRWFNDVVSGKYFMRYHFTSVVTNFQTFIPHAFWICFIAMGLWMVLALVRGRRDIVGWMWFIIVTMFWCAWKSPRELSHHFFFFYPLTFIVIAVMIGCSLRLLPFPRLRGFCGGAVCLLILLNAIPGWKEYRRQADREGGVFLQLHEVVAGAPREYPLWVAMNGNLTLWNYAVVPCMDHQNVRIALNQSQGVARWMMVVPLVNVQGNYDWAGYSEIIRQYDLKEMSRRDIVDESGRAFFRCVWLRRGI